MTLIVQVIVGIAIAVAIERAGLRIARALSGRELEQLTERLKQSEIKLQSAINKQEKKS